MDETQAALQQGLDPLTLDWMTATGGAQSMPSVQPVPSVDAATPAAPPAQPQQQQGWTKQDTNQLVKDINPVLRGISEGYLKQSELQMQREAQKKKFLADMMQKIKEQKTIAPLQQAQTQSDVIGQLMATLGQTRGA